MTEEHVLCHSSSYHTVSKIPNTHDKFECDILRKWIVEDIRELSSTLDQDNVLGKIKASADREKRSNEKHILDLEKQIIKLKDYKNALLKKHAAAMDERIKSKAAAVCIE